MTILRTEEHVVDRECGVLDVRGGDFDTALLIAGRIAAYQWNDCMGSIGQNLVRTTSSNPALALANFRRSVASAVPPDVSLAHHFAEAISLLASGKYLLQLDDRPFDTLVVELEAHADSSIDRTGFYGDFRSLVATQPKTALSLRTVQAHLSGIQRGLRPIAVTLSTVDSISEFILDGHHKVKAYREAAVPIRILAICRLDAVQVDLADALAFLPESGWLRDNLRTNKPEWRSET